MKTRKNVLQTVNAEMQFFSVDKKWIILLFAKYRRTRRTTVTHFSE